MYTSMLFRATLLLLVAILVNNCVARDENPDFKAVDEYITKQGVKKSIIKKAIDFLPIFHQLEGEDREALKPLTDGTNIENVIGILTSLLESADSCEDDKLSFLAMMIEIVPKNNQKLTRYARFRLRACWSDRLSSAPRFLESAIGKMPATFFKELAIVACEFVAIDERKKAREIKKIDVGVFNPRTMAEKEKVRISSMKKFNKSFKEGSSASFLTKKPSRTDQLLAINEAYEYHLEYSKMQSSGDACKNVAEFFSTRLLDMCEVMMKRMGTLMYVLNNYGKQLENSIQISTKERANNTYLDESLERYTMCENLIKDGGSIMMDLK